VATYIYMLDDGINTTSRECESDAAAMLAGSDWSWQGRIVKVSRFARCAFTGSVFYAHVGYAESNEGENENLD
jgi:hypothetical protein